MKEQRRYATYSDAKKDTYPHEVANAVMVLLGDTLGDEAGHCCSQSTRCKGSSEDVYRKDQLVQSHSFSAYPIGYEDAEQYAEQTEQQRTSGHQYGVLVECSFVHAPPP